MNDSSEPSPLRNRLSTVFLPATTIICFLLIVSLLTDTLGILDFSFIHLISILLIIAVLLLNIPLLKTFYTLTHKNHHTVTLLGGILLLLIGFIILLVTTYQFLWIASIPLLIAGLDLILNAQQIQRKELYLLTLTTFVYALFFLLTQTIPLLWCLIQQLSLFFSSIVGTLMGTPLLLGPSTSGVQTVLLFLIFMGTTFVVTPKKTKAHLWMFIGWKIGVLFAWILFLIFMAVVPFDTNQDAVKFNAIVFLFCCIPTSIFFVVHRFQNLPLKNNSIVNIRVKTLLKNAGIWAALFLIISSILLTGYINTTTSPSEHEKIAFYGQHMIGTWDIPSYGKYGRDAAGMFGLLPLYLTTSGYETELIVDNTTTFLNTTEPHFENITQSVNLTDYTSLIESPTITSEILTNVRILVITNLNKSFSSEEQTIIWEFVKNGGSLLVLGDHTNVSGLQTPLNDLLAPVGIQFRFDAALPLDQKFKWTTCSKTLYHPLSSTLTDHDELQISVGASLNITPPAEPLIIGTYALSDIGNTSNNEMAYLGDYEYSRGEQLGDLILVASAYYGDGKVLVFGDTSSFQNTALPSSYLFLHTIFSWLNNHQIGTIRALQISCALLFLIGAVIVYRLFRTTKIPFAMFPLVLCTALFLSIIIQPLLLPTPIFTENVAIIDASHGERASLELFTENSLTGLMLNLNRNNYVPIIAREFSTNTIRNSKVIIFNAPTQSFSSDELAFLDRYMTDGGFIVLATGYEDKDASLALLRSLGLDIEQIPLGPIPYVEANTSQYQYEPRFVDSWPISIDDSPVISYYNFTWNEFTYHLVVLKKHGKGGLLLISDSAYLLDKNIESIYDYWPGNIIFLKQLLTEIRSMEDHR